MVDQVVEISNEEIKEILYGIKDPEIPVLSILDMGIVRSVKENGTLLHIAIIPTYSGCPAMDTIASDIKKAFSEKGYTATVELVLSPAWSTDFMTKAGKEALQKYGIAAPLEESLDKAALLEGKQVVKCTNCGSNNTSMVSQFGSTACKALFKCNDCLEPFDYFKCLK